MTHTIYDQPILLVDDSKSNLLLMEIFLKNKGFTNLSFAGHADEALEHLKEHPCTLLLLDLNMPDISGLEFMHILEKNTCCQRPATIFVTATSDEKVLGECFEIGAVDFIRKPLDSGVELIARVTHALNDILKEEAIIHELHIDALSELFNRRYFNERCFDIYKKSTSLDRMFHLVLFDIDNFKLYNDTYGHPASDSVIRAVSQSLQTTVQSIGNLVFRVGGEEFAALFSTSKSENIETTIDEVCTNIKALKIEHTHNNSGFITLSGGHISVSKKNYTFNELYETCDSLLYEAKNSGKDKIIHKKL
jgi:diguanylate cyclase (GGDEF)-like protein